MRTLFARCSPRAVFPALQLAPLLLLLLLLPLPGCSQDPSPSRPKGVVLILLDTLRADRLGCYGYEQRPTSPRIDEFAREGVIFDAAISHAPWTIAALTSILSSHPDGRAFEDGRLRSSLVSEILNAGIQTAAFTEGGYFTDQFGFGLGFEEFEEKHYLFGGGIENTFKSALRWLEEHSNEPFFLVIHTYEAHMPYMRNGFAKGLDGGRIEGPFTQEVHEAVASGELHLNKAELEYLQALYDSGVLECDRWVGHFLDELERLELRGQTAVYLTSDHGEELAEDRFPQFAGDHGHALYDYLLHVPLIIDDPRFSGSRRITSQVRSIDILPTVCESLGVPIPGGVSGRSLDSLLAGKAEEDRIVRGGNTAEGPDREFVRWHGYKLIRRNEDADPDSPFAMLPELRLFDLAQDPLEANDLAGQHGSMLKLLMDALDRDPGAGEIAPESLDVPEDRKAQLRALGYGH